MLCLSCGKIVDQLADSGICVFCDRIRTVGDLDVIPHSFIDLTQDKVHIYRELMPLWGNDSLEEYCSFFKSRHGAIWGFSYSVPYLSRAIDLLFPVPPNMPEPVDNTPEVGPIATRGSELELTDLLRHARKIDRQGYIDEVWDMQDPPVQRAIARALRGNYPVYNLDKYDRDLLLKDVIGLLRDQSTLLVQFGCESDKWGYWPTY